MQTPANAPDKTPWGSFWSLTVIQSMNALNEKGVRFLLIGLGIWMAMELQYSLSVLIVLPFVLFSPLGGWLADRWSKTRLLQAMVLLQVFVLAGMTLGLWLENLALAVFCFDSPLAIANASASSLPREISLSPRRISLV